MSPQSPDTRPPTLPQDTYTLREAAETVGRSTKTILRWCRDGLFPNAEKVPGPKGDEWSIPGKDLGQIALDKGLTLTLDQTPVQTVSTQQDETRADIRDLMDTVANLKGEVGQLSGQNDQLTKSETDLKSRVRQLTDDLEQERSERQRNETQIAELDKAKAVSEALAEERKTELERERATVVEHLEQLEDERTLVAERDAELVSMGDRASELEKQSAERLSEAEKLKDSMGWWSRRRYEKRSDR